MSDKRSGYSMIEDMKPIIDGDVLLPNFKPQEIALVVNNIAAVGHALLAVWGWAFHKDVGRKQWAQFFLSPSGMGNANSGSFDGSGYVLIYRSGPDGPIVGRFAICEHTKVDAPGADHQHGWHPGSCSKCGLNMTIDSSD